MKAIQALTISLLLIVSGMQKPTPAQAVPEVFELPAGIVGTYYQANIQTILREKYLLKLESDVSTSAFRWSYGGGEIPQGLTLRPKGTIVGTPTCVTR